MRVTTNTDVAKEVEVFPGIYERRYFLHGSLAAAAALLALELSSGKTLAQTTSSVGTGTLSWDDFLKQSVPVAQKLIADPALNVDEYLYRIGSLATRLSEIPDSQLGSYKPV